MRLRPVLAALAIVLTAPIAARAGTPSDLDASFQAAFGHKAPLTRQTFLPTFMSAIMPSVSEPWPITVQLTPDRLIRLGPARWALIIKETITEIGHLYSGAIAVAYLRRTGDRWQSEGVWPELFYSGTFGQPANAGDAVETFGPAPLYFAIGQWCGQDSCFDDIGAVRLDPSGPRYLGDIDGSARFPTDPTAPDAENPYCETFAFTAKIAPPTIAGAIFSVVYEGWRAPPTKLVPKTPFNHVANMVEKDGTFVMQPTVPFPGCN